MSILSKLKNTAKQIAGWNSMKNNIQPNHNFGEKAIPDAPRYGDLSNWFAHPSIASKVHLFYL